MAIGDTNLVVMHDIPSVITYPRGYEAADTITYADKAGLWKDLFSDTESTANDGANGIARKYEMLDEYGYAEVAVGVRARATDELVGYAALIYDGRVGELCDLGVHTQHRNRGLGERLLARRLEIARALGVTSLYIPRLAATNTIARFYPGYGFRVQRDGSLALGKRPRKLLQYDY